MDLDERTNRPLTLKEVAWFLRVDRTTVLRMLQKGKLKGFKAGSHWRVLAKDLRDFMGVQ